MNIAFQRDIGFKTVAEIAYVGNFTQESGRSVDVNRLPLYVRQPGQSREQRAGRRQLPATVYGAYPGLGSVTSWFPISTGDPALQRAAAPSRSPSLAGPADGCLYTLAKGEGYMG